MTLYEIRVKGRSAPNWADWFGEMQVRATSEDGQKLSEFLLIGDLSDQSALLGLLMRLHNLNLTILSVRKIEEGINHE
jgi:hypothetical protein